MLPISVFDNIEIRIGRDSGPISLDCDAPNIPCNRENLVWRAAELFREAGGVGHMLHIVLKKTIPSGAGLGGGSSDAAGILLALNACHDNILPVTDLQRLALGLGADVPFFLHRRAALATGIGENLEFVEKVPEYPLLLIKPSVSVPTKWVYENLKLTRGRSHIKLHCFNNGPWQLEPFIVNDLEPVTASRYPIVRDLKRWLLERGALASSMSGSGPTVFGIFGSLEEVKAAESEARKDWKDFWISSASVISEPDSVIRRKSSF